MNTSLHVHSRGCLDLLLRARRNFHVRLSPSRLWSPDGCAWALRAASPRPISLHIARLDHYPVLAGLGPRSPGDCELLRPPRCSSANAQHHKVRLCSVARQVPNSIPDTQRATRVQEPKIWTLCRDAPPHLAPSALIGFGGHGNLAGVRRGLVLAGENVLDHMFQAAASKSVERSS